MDPSTRVIDFCHSELGTSFNCEGTVFEDNYGPSNLLSLEEASKTKGLRVETYVRPPVKITLTFKKPIHPHDHHHILFSQVGCSQFY